MYCEGNESGVKDWVASVQKLRYKDYQLVARPSQLGNPTEKPFRRPNPRWFEEVTSVKEFGAKMEEYGTKLWWRRAMGYSP